VNALDLILYIFSLVCFVLAAVNTAVARVKLIAAGLAFWVLVPLIATIQTLHP
jgi:hypothetical protein